MLKWQRGHGMMRGRQRWLLPALIVAGLLVAFLIVRSVGSWFQAPAPVTIAQASLQSMREQNRMIAFSARYVAVVTSTQRRLGGLIKAERTLIMPGDVRYELDLSKLTEENLRWNQESKTLDVTLPPIEISSPQIDINAIQQFDNNSLAFTLSNAGEVIDTANRDAALRSLTEQAKAELPMRLARESARRAIARNFELPLRAAGVEANVEVRFADEARDDRSQLDRSRPMNEVLGRPVEVKPQQ